MSKADIHRLLPQSADAEQGTLSSILLRPDEVIPHCLDRGIANHHFHIPAHATIYSALLAMHADSQPIDVVTLTDHLRSQRKLDQVGGPAYVADVFTFLPTAANALHYLEIIEKKHTLREIIRVSTEYGTRAYTEQDNLTGLLDGMEAELLRIVKARYGHSLHARTVRELVFRATERLEAAFHGDGQIDMPTSILDLDYHLGGFRQPEVTLIAGKPSDGKTALVCNIAEYLAVHRKKAVGIISMEMSDDQLTDRLIAGTARINLREIRRRRSMTPQEEMMWVKATNQIGNASIHIRDDGNLTPREISATLTAWKAKHGLDIAFIDHAQLMRAEGRTDGRTEEVEQISRSLKPMAKRLGIPLVVLSQVTDVAGGGYRTKNSTALQEDADNVLTISHSGDESWIVINKQRDGARNISVPVNWTPTIMRFSGKTEQEPQTELPIETAGQRNGKSRR